MELDLSVDMLDRMERTSSMSRELSLSSGDNAAAEVDDEHPSLQLELKLPCPNDQVPVKNGETKSSGGFETIKNAHLINSMKRPLNAPKDYRSYEMHPSSISSVCSIRPHRSYWRSSDDDEGSGLAARKKLRLTKEQSCYLEESFKEHATLNPKQKLSIAKKLNLRPRQVEVWFQNRRARTKLKQTENDFEYLKRCCEALTDENRRLHREIQELKALKFSFPQLRPHSLATTLTLCPLCERKAVVDNRKLTRQP